MIGDGTEHLHDRKAENALIGAMLLSEWAVETAGYTLVAGDFYSPANGILFDACMEMHEHGSAITAQTVGGYLSDRGKLAAVGGAEAILALMSSAPSRTGAKTYVERIKECSNRRTLHRAANDLLANLGAGLDAGRSADALHEQMSQVVLTTGGRELVTENFEDLVRAPAEKLPDWVIPGMLRRGNRLMITAPTKTGKATMIRQMAFGASRGIHPFTREPMDPRRVLLLDLENPRETYTDTHNLQMVDRIDLQSPGQNLLQVLMRGQGLNLRARSDRMLLEDLMRKQRPDILCICPVYKSFNQKGGGENSEALVEEVCEIYDHLRVTYDCALILEHHSPRGSVELFPFGSSVWERWVDFGRTMRKSEANPRFIEWGMFCAGDRLPVVWPEGFHWGERGWPFEAQYRDGEHPSLHDSLDGPYDNM